MAIYETESTNGVIYVTEGQSLVQTLLWDGPMSPDLVVDANLSSYARCTLMLSSLITM